MPSFSYTSFSRNLDTWFAEHQRDLPWRHAENAKNPYRILVSEVMLQQTTVAAVIPFYHRFLARFPDWKSLAHAPEDEVLALWAGLGYYSRARNLQKCAQTVVELGCFPESLAAILALPGIGRYTAGALASIAFEQAAPIVDANVARVLARVFLLEDDLKNRENQIVLWREAEILVKAAKKAGISPAQFNPAMMELGALICSPKNPKCELCPVSAFCAAKKANRQKEIPHSTPKNALTELFDVCAFAERINAVGNREILLRQRPAEAKIWWRGMWELPRVTKLENETPQSAFNRLGEEIGLEIRAHEAHSTLKHGVTRYQIALESWRSEIEVLRPSPAVGWFEFQAARELAMPSVMKKLVRRLELEPEPARQLALL